MQPPLTPSAPHHAWLEIVEPSASPKQIALWRADPMVPGMRISLEGRAELGIGRLPRDELKAGTLGDDKHYCRLQRRPAAKTSEDAWMITGPRSTTLNGRPLATTPKALEDGDVVDGGTLAFRFRAGAADPLLGVAWRAGDDVIAFPCAFPKVRRFRALALGGREPRVCAVVVEHEPTRHADALGKVVHRASTALVVEVPLVDGPTLRQLLDKTRDHGADVDGAFFAEMCATVEGVVASLDDVTLGFDGTVRSSSLHAKTPMPPGVRLRRLLEAMHRPVAEERAGPAALGGLVRQLFPEEAARTDAVLEEAPMLSCEGWRARVSR